MTEGLGDAASGMAQGSSVVVPVVATGGDGSKPEKRPLYPRLLHLQHIHPNAWQRAVLGEGALGVAALLCLADVASLWTLVVLPVAVAGVVKAHDVLQGRLETTSAQQLAADAELISPDERAPLTGIRAKDLSVLGALMDNGADLRQPREVRHFLVAPSRDVAAVMADAARGAGWSASTADAEGTVELVCERGGVVLADAAEVRHASDFFEALAELHGAEYDGWEAAVQPTGR